MEAGPLDKPFRDENEVPGAAFPGGPPAEGSGPDASRSPHGSGAGGAAALDTRSLDTSGMDHLLDAIPGQHSPDEHELRPKRRLHIWQTAPIVALGVLGSLMFAFPLAFEFGDGGAMVAMLGVLLSASSAGWGIMVARRVGYAWPGLPPRGSDRRPDWRFVLGYAVLSLLIAALAVWRVARLH